MAEKNDFTEKIAEVLTLENIIIGVKILLSFILSLLSVRLYIMFADTRDPFYALVGITALGVGGWLFLEQFEELKVYETLILPFASGLFIFLLFMEEGFDKVILDSEIAYLQIRTSVIISTTMINFLYILGVIIGVILLIPIIWDYYKHQKITRIDIPLFALLGIIMIIFFGKDLIWGELGMPYKYSVRTYPEDQTLLYNPLEFIFSIFYILSLVIGLILVSLNVYYILQEKEISYKYFIGSSIVASTLLFFSIMNFIIGDFGLSNTLLFPNLGFVTFPSGGKYAGTVTIDAACSGIHSFTIFMTCFYLTFLYIGRNVEKTRLAIALAIGTFGTLSCNWIRLVIIYWSGYHMGYKTMQDVHDYAGLVVFLIWMVIFWIYALDYLKIREKKEIIQNEIQLTTNEKTE